MLRVDAAEPDLVDFVDDVEEVALRIDARLLDGLQRLANDALAGRGVGALAHRVEKRDQFVVHEREDVAGHAVLQFYALRAVGGGPVAPAVGRLEGGGEGDAQRFVLRRLQFLALVEDAEEEHPREFGDVLEGGGAVGAPQNVADALDARVHRRLGCERGHSGFLRPLVA